MPEQVYASTTNKIKPLFSWRKALKIAREYFPDIPKTTRGREFLGYVIWNGTGWPCFWEDESEQHFRKQLQKAKEEFETHGHLLENE